jgi:NAD(P)H-nitrite reductase large subunit
MGHMRWKDIEPYEPAFWSKNNIQLIQNTVTQINYDQKRLQFINGDNFEYDQLILATGSVSNQMQISGIHLNGVSGLYSRQDLEFITTFSSNIRHAVISGGGLIGIELAEMFHSRNIPVSLVVRESDYWSNILPPQESKMISNHIRQHGIDLRLSTQIKEIEADGQGNVAAVITDKNENINCQFVGQTIGVSPNINFLRNTLLECDKGILVNEYLETNITDVFAIGDCAQLRNPTEGRRPIEPVWYTAKAMGQTLAQTLCTKRSVYDTGIWFNSAKFFDIEYQVYGQVPAQLKDPFDSFYWENKDGNKSVRLVFDKDNLHIKGFNLMGIRFRQEICEHWIKSNTTLEEVLSNIRFAFFDPEFYKDLATPLIEKYNAEKNRSVVAAKKNSMAAFLKS